jgi:hypothetical protein
MIVSQKALELLQQRLKNVDNSVENAELERLANAVVAISKLETTDDVVTLGDIKLSELNDYASEKLLGVDQFADTKQAELLLAKNEQLSAIADSGQDNLNAILELSEEKQSELNFIVNNFATMNDIPEDSSICAEISNNLEKYKFLNPGDLPFVFGILSRYDDYYDGFTTALGTWYNANADIMFGLLTGCHSYTNLYSGFYLEPKLCFLQGEKGNFIKKKNYVKRQVSTSQYAYPYAALGCLFVKNVTDEAITSTITFGGSSYATTGGAGMFVGTPGGEAITWTNVYSVATTSTALSSTASIAVPAHTTIAIILYTSSSYLGSPGTTASPSVSYVYHGEFLMWRLNEVRSGFLQPGLEIDFEKTLKAWQCPGFATTVEIFN